VRKLTKEQIEKEIWEARKERNAKEDKLNYVTKPKYHNALSHEIIALTYRIEGLMEDLKELENKSSLEETCEFWNGYIRSTMLVPIGIIGTKKDTAVAKQNSI
jgi:hypothetical protein